MRVKPFTIGERRGTLTFTGPAEPVTRSNGYLIHRGFWLCDCGKEIIVWNQAIRSGHTTSCGCSRRKINITHGQCRNGVRSRAYTCWCGVVQRCTNPNNSSAENYGDRGIKMYEPWLNSFEAFFDYMGPGKKGWSIERVGNNGNYEPMNCVWATMVRQARNRRSNLTFTVRGVTGILIELVEHFGCDYMHVYKRIRLGWDPERAFFEPRHNKGRQAGQPITSPP